ILTGEFNSDAQQVEAKHAHPACAIALFEAAAVSERGVAIEHANVIEPKETTLENVVAFRIFAVHPPGESDEQLVENYLEESAITFAPLLPFDLVYAPGSPRNHGRIDIAKMPFVCGDLAIRMLVPLAHNEIELALGKLRIDKRERDAVKGEVPGRIPWKFPFIRHRHYAFIVKMTPLRVAPVFALFRRRWVGGITLEPLTHDVMIKLFAPKHSRERLTLDRAVLLAQANRRERRVKFVGFVCTLCKQIIEVREWAERLFAFRNLL